MKAKPDMKNVTLVVAIVHLNAIDHQAPTKN